MIKKIYSIIQLTASSTEGCLWFDHDDKEYQPHGWGIVFKLSIGKMIRPIPKFWKLGWWRGDEDYNPWKGGEYWFIIRLPIMLGIFLSVAFWRFGAYIGCKTFKVKHYHKTLDRYGRWLQPGEAGTDEEPAVYLQPSMTFRRTRWK